ncbi:MAG: hypothetical protein M3116_01710, partial [Actinomycetota bacterium]|nr:hypothetical protein [Actinomycetota bacterium]
FCWNDILIALLVMQSPSQRTVMVGVSALRGRYPDNVPVYLAGVLLVVIPLVIVYLIFPRQIPRASPPARRSGSGCTADCFAVLNRRNYLYRRVSSWYSGCSTSQSAMNGHAGSTR